MLGMYLGPSRGPIPPNDGCVSTLHVCLLVDKGGASYVPPSVSHAADFCHHHHPDNDVAGVRRGLSALSFWTAQ